MKILLVHEFYRSCSPSGEDTVFLREQGLLSNAGYEVNTLSFSNDSIGTAAGPSLLKTALSTPWSSMGRKLLRSAVDRFKPDVVHFHNTFPVLSQAALWEARRCGAATVQTLHNYRWFCANGLLMRNGAICEICLRKGPWPALQHRCYRNSLVATFPLVINIALHRWLRTAWRAVDQLVVLTSFAKQQLISMGIPKDLVFVKPNFFSDPYGKGNAEIKWDPQRERNWIFVGRLKEEKGVQYLPETWERLGPGAPVLHIVGDGPLQDALMEEVRSRHLKEKIVFEGFQPPERVLGIFKQAGLLIFPSVCYEGFPLTIGEAFAAGVPVAASRIGAMASLIKDGQTGVLFEPGHVGDMGRKLVTLQEKSKRLAEMGRLARAEYEAHYTPSRNLELLVELYRTALDLRNKRLGLRPRDDSSVPRAGK